MIATDRERQRQVVARHRHQHKPKSRWQSPKHREGDHVQVDAGLVGLSGPSMVEVVIVNDPRSQAPFIYGIELVTDRGVMLWANERELY